MSKYSNTEIQDRLGLTKAAEARYNVTQVTGLAYGSAAEAAADVPEEMRTGNMVMEFKSTDGNWYMVKYQPAPASNQ